MRTFKPINNVSDSLLWSHLIQGDEEAFSELFEKYYSVLVNYGKSLTSLSSCVVKDCVQDVFIDVWNYRKSLNENVVVKAYLLSSIRKRIARVNQKDHIFRNVEEVENLNFLMDFSVEDAIIANEELAEKVKRLNKSINNLSARKKEALYLRFYQGLSVEEVSVILEMNYQSAKNLLHRTVLLLRKEFLLYFLLFSLWCLII